jgi:hypothetical protein
MPLIAARPKRIAPATGVKPEPDSLMSGGSSLIPCERSSEPYLKILARVVRRVSHHGGVEMFRILRLQVSGLVSDMRIGHRV